MQNKQSRLKTAKNDRMYKTNEFGTDFMYNLPPIIRTPTESEISLKMKFSANGNRHRDSQQTSGDEFNECKFESKSKEEDI